MSIISCMCFNNFTWMIKAAIWKANMDRVNPQSAAAHIETSLSKSDSDCYRMVHQWVGEYKELMTSMAFLFICITSRSEQLRKKFIWTR